MTPAGFPTSGLRLPLEGFPRGCCGGEEEDLPGNTPVRTVLHSEFCKEMTAALVSKGKGGRPFLSHSAECSSPSHSNLGRESASSSTHTFTLALRVLSLPTQSGLTLAPWTAARHQPCCVPGPGTGSQALSCRESQPDDNVRHGPE